MRKAVLIIENSEQDVSAIRSALREGNLSNPVITFGEGAGARAWLNGEGEKRTGNRIGVVLVNIHNRECGGLDLLEWLRDQPFFPALLIVALTERSQLRDVVKAYERGAHTFLVKPVHMEDVKSLARTYPQHCG